MSSVYQISCVFVSNNTTIKLKIVFSPCFHFNAIGQPQVSVNIGLCLSDVTNTEFMFLSNVTNTEQMNYYEMAHTYNNMELTSQAKGLFKLFVCMIKGQDRKCWLNFTP
jgi:hypothetical protein